LKVASIRIYPPGSIYVLNLFFKREKRLNLFFWFFKCTNLFYICKML